MHYQKTNWANTPRSNNTRNKLDKSDNPIHDWYRFVLSYPPHLVREYISKFQLKDGSVLLDPFCGTGTTIVEAKLRGINGIGIEAHPMSYFASCVKTDWEVEPNELRKHALLVYEIATKALSQDGINDHPILNRNTDTNRYRKLPPELESLLLKNSISPMPLHKSLVLIESISMLRDERFYKHELLALAKTLVHNASNLHFGPEVGVRGIKEDAIVINSWLDNIKTISTDLENLEACSASTRIILGDSRNPDGMLEPKSIDAVFTSPPYPNEKDYTRTTRLESVLLGFVNSKSDLQALKKNLIRSNTRGVYKTDCDDEWVSDNLEIQKLSSQIEEKRLELNKTSGFEKLYHRVTKLYFGGMKRHLIGLKPYLKPGALLGYVVGDQASYLQIHIPTGKLLAEMAESVGYELVSIDLFRTRFASATKKQMREEVVVLRRPGK